ncbi:MAG: hypothetical protein EOM90_16900 [Alphaproteobacteria bacterium]|nr:hypothetical protein [Alphaproteobacteria bacterium]
MTVATISPMQAQFEMALLNAEAESTSSSNLYLWLRESGMPSEVAIRIQSLVDQTAVVAGQVYCIGKIVVIKIIEFVKAHPDMAIGMVVGASVGALTSMIPFLGPYLAPIAIAIGATVGAVAGHRSDKMDMGLTVNSGVIAVAQDLLEIAKQFFKLLIEIFNAVFTQAKQ